MAGQAIRFRLGVWMAETHRAFVAGATGLVSPAPLCLCRYFIPSPLSGFLILRRLSTSTKQPCDIPGDYFRNFCRSILWLPTILSSIS
jgi:hypothetical protein